MRRGRGRRDAPGARPWSGKWDGRQLAVSLVLPCRGDLETAWLYESKIDVHGARLRIARGFAPGPSLRCAGERRERRRPRLRAWAQQRGGAKGRRRIDRPGRKL